MKTAGSIFSGGGLLDEAVKQAGFQTVFGIEQNPKYAAIWRKNHEGVMYEGCISDVPMCDLPPVSLITGGIPCEPFSRARRQSGNQKRKAAGYVDHSLADMTLWAFAVINHCRPKMVVLEEVEDYIVSEIGQVMLRALSRIGYTVDFRIVKGTEYGALTTRKRVAIVGVTGEKINWPDTYESTRTLKDVLHEVDDDRCQWFHIDDKTWLRDHWIRQTERGNGFISQKLDPSTPSVQAITKRYFAGQGDNPVVCHPTEADTYRWLTIDEVKSIMGLPQSYDLGSAKTTAGEIMGQGVLVDVFRQIIESIATTNEGENHEVQPLIVTY